MSSKRLIFQRILCASVQSIMGAQENFHRKSFISLIYFGLLSIPYVIGPIEEFSATTPPNIASSRIIYVRIGSEIGLSDSQCTRRGHEALRAYASRATCIGYPLNSWLVAVRIESLIVALSSGERYRRGIFGLDGLSFETVLATLSCGRF
jgi:hypothetical protein